MQQTLLFSVLGVGFLLSASCISPMVLHADLATTINEAAEREREAYRDARKDAMRQAGRAAPQGDLELVVRGAGATFDANNEAWREAIAAIAITNASYVAAVLARRSGWKATAARLLRQVVAAYEEIRRFRPRAPSLPLGLIDTALAALEGS